MSDLTLEDLKSLLRYDSDSGEFFWIKARRGPGALGGVAGSMGAQGYHRIMLNGKTYTAHRLAWLYMKGEFPRGLVDHINHDRSDNRWGNLREVSHSNNSKNAKMSSKNHSGVSGVCWDKNKNKWRVSIRTEKKQIHGGYYDSLSEAKDKRADLNKMYNFHCNHGLA
jgi:hypothetical protein